MASFHVTGLDDLQNLFSNLADLPSSVIGEILEAQADVAARAQQQASRSMLQGPFNRGAVAASIGKSKLKLTADGGSIFVELKGHQHGNRMAEIAFINEYGKRGQPARPFIQTANEGCVDEVVDAAERVFDEFMNF